MDQPDERNASDSDDTTEEPAAPAPTIAGTGPYPQLLHYQLLTPRAPLPPGAGIRMYPIPPHVLTGSIPARWAEDPTGRHQWRWWNGRIWTDHVADDGEATTDPLD